MIPFCSYMHTSNIRAVPSDVYYNQKGAFSVMELLNYLAHIHPQSLSLPTVLPLPNIWQLFGF